MIRSDARDKIIFALDVDTLDQINHWAKLL